MTLSEFKAWFEGFTEAIDKQPTQKQWARIKARVAEIDGQPITKEIYVDRYWHPYQRYWHWSGPIALTDNSTYSTNNPGFNANTAMYSLGVAEAHGDNVAQLAVS